MPKISQAHFEGRRDFILETAAQVFARQGFHATSMADLIVATQLSAGSMYRYFKNKDDLITAIIDRYLESLSAAFQRISRDASGPGDAVEMALELVSHRFGTTDDEPFPHLLPQVWSEAVRNPAIRERGQRIYSVLLENFRGIVLRAQAAGTLSSALSPQGTASVMLSLVQGYILQVNILGVQVHTEQYRETVHALFTRPNE